MAPVEIVQSRHQIEEKMIFPALERGSVCKKSNHTSRAIPIQKGLRDIIKNNGRLRLNCSKA